MKILFVTNFAIYDDGAYVESIFLIDMDREFYPNVYYELYDVIETIHP